MAIKLSFLFIISIFTSSVNAGTRYITTDFDAIPSDGIDDTIAIQNALSSGHTIYFPDGIYLISSNLHTNDIISKDSVFLSVNNRGAILKSTNINGNIINLNYFKGMDKFVFDNIRLRINGNTDTLIERRVRWNEFINMRSDTWCISLDKTLYVPDNINIYQNHFQQCHYAVAGFVRNSTIAYNTSDSGVQRHIWLSGSENVTINNNLITGGTVGIGFLCKHNGSIIESNIIRNNILNDIREEGISFDMQGNNETSYSRWSSNVVGWDKVKGNRGIVTRIYVEGDAANINDIIGNNTVLTFYEQDNSNKGNLFVIANKGISTGDYEGFPYIDILNGPKNHTMYENAKFIVLSYPVINNEIINNNITNTGRTGIGLHGAGMHTLISGNTISFCNSEPNINNDIWGGITIKNINNAGVTKGKHGPTFFNEISNNSLQGVGCNIKAWTLNYGGSVEFNATGNTQQNNSLSNGESVIWLDQE